MFEENILKAEEKAIFSLRSLYRKRGYQPYKMSKFEEYDFYARNKDFLVSDGVITFTDTNGKLMALKPDVTLSIIKNYKAKPGCTQRVYYNENVYRISGDTHEYKEIMQTGLECMGDIDLYNKLEVLRLALDSLEAISDDYRLVISHMGILSAILDKVCADEDFKSAVSTCVSEKNPHEIARLCEENGVDASVCEELQKFISIYGERTKVIAELEALSADVPGMADAIEELRIISNAVDDWALGKYISFDFSLVNDMNYYNGLVFQGYVNGIPDVMLSGGQYDRLMKRIGIDSGAMGFALYLDQLEMLSASNRKYDVDIVILYSDDSDIDALADTVHTFNKQGKTVSVQKAVPEKVRYKTLMKFNDKGVEILEDMD